MSKKEQTTLSFRRLIGGSLETFQDFLVNPNCLTCGTPIEKTSDSLCFDCWLSLPFLKNNQTDGFQSRLSNYPWINQSWSWCYFSENLGTQRLVHQFKYEQNKKLASHLGEVLGKAIQRKKLDYDFVVPVPLHPKKFVIRGYNQAQIIAKSIAENCDTDLQKLAIRVKHNVSQTRLSNRDRWTNSQFLFRALDVLNDQKETRILLVDDVFTTGSTLVSLSKAIYDKYPNVRIDTATLMTAV